MIENYDFKVSGRLVRLGNAINRHRNMQMAFLDLTSTQSEAIRYIIKNNDMNLTAKDLMNFLNLSQSTVAGIIDRLCDKGFIIRKKCESDSRKVFIALSEKGMELDDQLHVIGAETEALLLNGMTAKEADAFKRLLGIALSNMDITIGRSYGSGGRQRRLIR